MWLWIWQSIFKTCENNLGRYFSQSNKYTQQSDTVQSQKAVTADFSSK